MSSVMRLWPQQTVWTPCPLCRHSVEVETHFWHSIPDFDLKLASIIVQTAFPAQGYGKGEKNKQLLPGTSDFQRQQPEKRHYTSLCL